MGALQTALDDPWSKATLDCLGRYGNRVYAALKRATRTPSAFLPSAAGVASGGGCGPRPAPTAEL